jgi:drug/metabolite transporter (DMT)-like permease
VEIIILIATAGILWGIGPILDKYSLRYFSPENAIFLRILSAVIMITTFFFSVSNPKSILNEFNWRGALAVVASGFAGFVGVYIFMRLLRVPDAPVAKYYAIALAISPIVTAILAYFLFAEPILKPIKILGIMLIVGGIYILSYQSHA